MIGFYRYLLSINSSSAMMGQLGGHTGGSSYLKPAMMNCYLSISLLSIGCKWRRQEIFCFRNKIALTMRLNRQPNHLTVNILTHLRESMVKHPAGNYKLI
jgi:hypothetical protein